VWVTLIATLFTVIQLVLNFSAPKPAVEAGVELNHLIKKVDELEARLPPAGKIEQSVGGAKPLSPPPYGSSSELSSVPSHSPSESESERSCDLDLSKGMIGLELRLDWERQIIVGPCVRIEHKKLITASP
jgi:hypothetical protein